MVTQQDLEAAEAAVIEAEDELSRAERHHAVVGSEQAGAHAYYAKHQADGAREAARKLRARWEVEGATRDARAAAEETAAGGVPGMKQKLADARDEAAHAVAALDRVVTEALAAVHEYTGLVRQTSGELLALGLRAGEGNGDGGRADGCVHLDGETWWPADAASMVAAVASLAVAGTDPRHPLAQQRWRHVGGQGAAAGQAALLKVAAR
ncbi:hypothetical protein ACFY3G_43295 [Streptomyces phaeochromogenes]|uniref:hypothetical protein n=1 Tax=Streptomyces phaeochromogenes TaxID=1923 RepID=UPI0036BD8B03